ncbi:MAG: phosphatidate cytidylyltransferase [Actinomycetia bacterium]|nr:phosphatidate cytidylyltransferase [Actinomycetes bacterium]
MRVRVLTSVVYALLMIALTLINEWTCLLMCAAISGICAFEFYAMLRSDAKQPNELIGVITSACYPVAYFFWHFNGLLTLTVLSATVLLIWYIAFPQARITDVAVTLFGSCYTGMMLSSLVAIRDILPGFWGGMLVLGVTLSVWSSDVLAYFFGSRLGRHKLAPHISPNKSWEGFIAGIFGSLLFWFLISLIPGLDLPLGWALLGGFFCAWIGILGDLVESRIKRSTGHKDSGRLLPGHGGFLDRNDSLFLAAAIAALYFRLLGLN